MGFLHDLVVPDLNHLLVPTVMAGLIVFMGLTGSMARSSGLDNTLAYSPVEQEFNESVIDSEYTLFDDVSGQRMDRLERVRVQSEAEIKQARSDMMAMITGVLLHFTYNTPLFVLLPSSPKAFITSEHEPRLYPRSDGYFLSQSIPEAAAVRSYRNEKLTALSERVNADLNEAPDSWSLEEYRAEVNQIRQVSYGDEAVRTYIEDAATDPEIELVFDDPDIEEHVRAGSVKEVGIMHFVPAIVGTFVLYYLLFGLLMALLGLVFDLDESTEQQKQQPQPRRQGPSQNRRRNSR